MTEEISDSEKELMMTPDGFGGLCFEIGGEEIQPEHFQIYGNFKVVEGVSGTEFLRMSSLERLRCYYQNPHLVYRENDIAIQTDACETQYIVFKYPPTDDEFDLKAKTKPDIVATVSPIIDRESEDFWYITDYFLNEFQSGTEVQHFDTNELLNSIP
ncbi:hypothetical protein [Terasakiella pusilla]|uniref:hypothetical protein n=1 Tax=Terasakiella pusilla TaxID=64973 RepID=UPI003AA7DB77